MRSAPNPTPGDPLNPDFTPRIFVDATPASGIQGEFGGDPWQPIFRDLNRDGWPDLQIAHDFAMDVMFINNHNGTFLVGDVDNNGVLDSDDLTAWSALPPH